MIYIIDVCVCLCVSVGWWVWVCGWVYVCARARVCVMDTAGSLIHYIQILTLYRSVSISK